MIEITQVSKTYDDFVAVDGISFKVERGEIVGFLGPNGAGKSSTMKILTGYMPPSSGTVLLDGKDIFQESLYARRRMGYLPETTPLYSDMTVYSYLKHVGKMRGILKTELLESIRESILLCGLKAQAKQKISKLSKGYKQRVGLAQALLHKPELLILDEPSSGLDPNQIVEIRHLIRELGKERTIILSTHNLPEVMATCSRIIIIHKGKIVADGSPEALEEGEAAVSRLEILLRGVSENAAKVGLAAIPGVQALQDLPHSEEGVLKFEVSSAKGVDLRPLIYQEAVKEAWELLGMKRLRLDLEGLFRTLTEEA